MLATSFPIGDGSGNLSGLSLTPCAHLFYDFAQQRLLTRLRYPRSHSRRVTDDLGGTTSTGEHTHTIIQTLFYSSTYGLIIAYAIRFLAVGISPAEAGFNGIPKYLDEAAKQLGKNRLSTFCKVHLPLLKPSILAGFLILFIDVLKELPLTLIMQPFNTETLAMQTYKLFASQENLPWLHSSPHFNIHRRIWYVRRPPSAKITHPLIMNTPLRVESLQILWEFYYPERHSFLLRRKSNYLHCGRKRLR